MLIFIQKCICISEKSKQQVEEAGNRHAEAKKAEFDQHAGNYMCSLKTTNFVAPVI